MIGNICKLLKKICYQLAEYMEHERGLRKLGREGRTHTLWLREKRLRLFKKKRGKEVALLTE